MSQGKRRASDKNYTKLNANTRQRKESKKNAKTGKQQSRKQNKKKCNENNNTVFVHKNATGQEKTQGKNKTTGKIFRTENKDSANRKSPKGLQNGKTKQQEANLGNEASCQQIKIFFRFQFFKKNRPIKNLK